jgi:hypothetical protein
MASKSSGGGGRKGRGVRAPKMKDWAQVGGRGLKQTGAKPKRKK